MVAPDAQVAAIADEIEQLLLPGPRKRVTDDVREWGEQQGRSLTDNRLLEEYNRAVDESHEAAGQRLVELAGEEDRRPVLLRLLNEPRSTDLDRILTLKALAGHVGPEELPELGRVSARQRPGVIPALLELLATIDHPHARFIERKVVPGSSPTPESDLDGELLEQSRDSEGASLFAGLALEEAEMGSLKDAGKAARTALGDAADALDEELVAAGRKSSGLSDYESIVRRELHLLSLLASLPVGERLADRARDSLLATDLDRFEWRVAPQLPADELATYLRRSLSPENRRKSPDRAGVALRCIGVLPIDMREELRDVVLNSLRDRNADVRFEAAAALSEHLKHSEEEQSLLVNVLAGLPDDHRARLQPLLGALGSQIEAMEFPRAIEWAASAPADEVAQRAVALFSLWSDRVSDVTGQEAESAMGLCARASSFSGGPLPAELSSALVNATDEWLKAHRGTAAATRSLMAGWLGFPDFVLDRFGSYTLNAKASRRLLTEAIRAGGAIAPERLARAAEIELDDEDRFSSVVMDAVRVSLERDPSAFEDAAASTTDQGLRVLLAVALELTGELGRSHDELDAATAEETTRALDQAREQVLEALELAERDSVKNEDLKAQLALVRRALGFDDDSPSALPSEAVTAWRTGARERFPSLALVDDGTLRLGDSAEDVMGVMLDLDPRVHGRGVVPADDRNHYAKDLAAAVDAYSRLPDPPDLPRTASAKLRDKVARAVAGDSGRSDLGLLEALGGGKGPTQARRLAIEARNSDTDSIEEALRSLTPPAARAAVPGVAAALVGEHKAYARSSEARKTQEARAAAEIARKLAVPFQAIESRLFSYFRLRAILEQVGWKQVADHLGAEVRPDAIGPDRFSIRAEDPEPSDPVFLVRSLGIQIDDTVVEPAVIERVSSVSRGEEEEIDRA